MKIANLEELVENCPANYGGDSGSRYIDALVAKVSNITSSGEFHREFETRSFTDRELKKLRARPGDLFVVKSSGSKKNILSGKTAIVAEDSPAPLIASNFLLLLRPRTELVEPRYLWRVLNSSQSKAFVKTVVGAFTYPNLKWSTYRKHPVPLPPLSEQKRIAVILDAADALRAKRRESIAQLDTLLQSTFIEMFGDPVTNPMGWEVKSLGNLAATKPNNGIFRKNPDYIENGNGLPVVWVGELFRGNQIDTSSSRLLEATQIEVEKYGLRYGDVLFCRSSLKEDGIAYNNVYLGYANETLFECHLIRVSPRIDICNPMFLSLQLRTVPMRALLKSKSKTATMTTIDQKSLSSVEVVLPPLERQDRFAAIVKSVEQQKSIQRAHLAELDTLFASLQSRAFSGEL